MTEKRRAVTRNRYLGYLDAWRHLANGTAVRTTYAELAWHSNVRPASVGPALKRMQDLGMISELIVHQSRGTEFRIAESPEKALGIEAAA